MNYCINYNPQKGFKYLNEISEITINYRRKDTSLLDFMLQHKEQRINIKINDEQDFLDNNCIGIFERIKLEYPELNFVLLFSDKNEELLSQVKTSEIKYFFTTLIKDWDSLYYIKDLKPTDIYIVETLGFELDVISQILHEENIKIRCFANVAQSSAKTTPALKQFFIRPEDIDFYEPYIDCIEFFGQEGKDHTLEIYYKIYKYDKKWFGKLNEIIIGLNSDIDSRFILPKFAERRLGCGKRCLKGRPCQICEAIEGLSATLEKNNLMIADFEK